MTNAEYVDYLRRCIATKACIVCEWQGTRKCTNGCVADDDRAFYESNQRTAVLLDRIEELEAELAAKTTIALPGDTDDDPDGRALLRIHPADCLCGRCSAEVI